jgi:hypothetical protein
MRRSVSLILLFTFFAVGCASREIFHPRGCEERLAVPYKRMECVACVTRPLPHVFLPDNPDGMRCARR